jgi:hypothetical protein
LSIAVTKVTGAGRTPPVIFQYPLPERDIVEPVILMVLKSKSLVNVPIKSPDRGPVIVVGPVIVSPRQLARTG